MDYKLLSTNLTVNGTNYKTYGITYESIKIEDISFNKEKVEQLIEQCNTLQISSTHIFEVIDDFFAQAQNDEIL